MTDFRPIRVHDAAQFIAGRIGQGDPSEGLHELAIAADASFGNGDGATTSDELESLVASYDTGYSGPAGVEGVPDGADEYLGIDELAALGAKYGDVLEGFHTDTGVSHGYGQSGDRYARAHIGANSYWHPETALGVSVPYGTLGWTEDGSTFSLTTGDDVSFEERDGHASISVGSVNGMEVRIPIEESRTVELADGTTFEFVVTAEQGHGNRFGIPGTSHVPGVRTDETSYDAVSITITSPSGDVAVLEVGPFTTDDPNHVDRPDFVTGEHLAELVDILMADPDAVRE